MIVFIGGMPRSGSTFSFNVVRDLLARRGCVHQEPFPEILPVVERSGAAAHVIVKSHIASDVSAQLIRVGAAKSIVTVRKPEDAVASLMDTFNFTLDQAIEQQVRWFASYDRIRDQSLVIGYDSLDRAPFNGRLAHHEPSDRYAQYLGGTPYRKAPIKG